MAKTVFITGATSGFGRATAKRFDSEGWQTIITGRRGERLDSLKAELTNPCHSAVLDVTKKDDVNALVEALPADFTPIDVLVNNAGLALGLEGADEVAMDDWETMIDTNIKGLLYCTRAILPQMVANGYGHVVNIGSIAGYWPYPGGNVYGATKAFVRQFTLNLRADLVGKNIQAWPRPSSLRCGSRAMPTRRRRSTTMLIPCSRPISRTRCSGPPPVPATSISTGLR